MPSITCKLSKEAIQALRSHLTIDPKPVPYAHFRGRYKGHVLTAYESGKVLIQGQAPERIINDLPGLEGNQLASQKKAPNSYQTSPSADSGLSIIGSDENGKGSYTGSLTVCAVYLPHELAEKVQQLGVKDSKKLSDDQILILSPKLRQFLIFACCELTPSQYNQLHQSKNINAILAHAHHHVLQQVAEKVQAGGQTLDRVVVDQFVPKDKFLSLVADRRPSYAKQLICQPKAEDDYLVVACASIIAREAFLKSLSRLGQPYGGPLPSGANPHVDQYMARLVKQHGFAILDQLVKTHFGNTQKLKEILGGNQQSSLF